MPEPQKKQRKPSAILRRHCSGVLACALCSEMLISVFITMNMLCFRGGPPSMLQSSFSRYACSLLLLLLPLAPSSEYAVAEIPSSFCQSSVSASECDGACVELIDRLCFWMYLLGLLSPSLLSRSRPSRRRRKFRSLVTTWDRMRASCVECIGKDVAEICTPRLDVFWLWR